MNLYEHTAPRSLSWELDLQHLHDTSKIVGRPLSSSFRLHLQCAIHEIGTQRGAAGKTIFQQRGYGALVGLHSNWIGHFILASARPSDRLLEEHYLLYQLDSQHIAAVINLQVPGEHGSCGDGVKPESGFSYTPQHLMERQIFYFTFPVEDSKHFELDYMLDICHTGFPVECRQYMQYRLTGELKRPYISRSVSLETSLRMETQ
ncbi:hypothetical protein R1sor_023755 [Riccia sorocarpa]|uniref:Uncharacterized protein n=1 Tax=Riccia sorocarpa TaxID=122646 RepID=A0ABD3GSN0_9MARC